MKRTALLFLGSLLVFGCRSARIDSTWRNKAIQVDGNATEWLDMQFIPEGERVALGVANDESTLYLSFRTSDRAAIMQILSFGFTVWFDSKGGTREKLGLRYPIAEDMRSMRGTLRTRSMSPEDVERWVETVLASQVGIEIIGPDKGDLARLPLKNNAGLEIGVVYSNGQFVYELKIPFKNASDQFFAIETEPGRTIGIGFQTGRPNISAMRGRMTPRLGDIDPGGRGGTILQLGRTPLRIS